MHENIKIIEPIEDWKRTAFINSLNRKRIEFDKNEIKIKLRKIRENSIENYQKLSKLFEKNIKKKGAKVFTAKNSKQAIDYIARITDKKNMYINKSLVIDELRDEIQKRDFEIFETYKDEFAIVNHTEKKNYWEIANIPDEILWDSFTINSNLKDDFENDYNGIGLLGANVVSANDGSIFFLQHSTNISKILKTLDKIFIIVTIDKIVENYDEAYFQTKCVSLFGLKNILNELSQFPPLIEENSRKKQKGLKSGIKSKDSREVHVILLDNGRSKIIKSEFKELSYCISCKACRSACPLLNSLKGKNRDELSGKEIIFNSIIKDLKYSSDKGLYECTLCENCQHDCPVDIPTPSFIAETRIKAEKFMPDVHVNINKNISEFDNPFREEKENRNMFYKRDYEKKKESILLFFGCVASYQRGKIISSTTKILDSLGIDYFVLGEEEGCCGYPSYISGSNDFHKIVKRNIKIINDLEPKLLLTTCAGCIKTFRNLYPKFEKFDTKAMHIVEYLSELISTNKLEFNKEFKKKVTYHDPCDLGRALNIFDEPRVILNSIPGLEFVEFIKNKEYARCCGSGGGLKAFDDEMSLSIGADRLNEAMENDIDIVVSACPACAMNLQHSSRKLKDEKNVKIKVMDIMEVVARAI